MKEEPGAHGYLQRVRMKNFAVIQEAEIDWQPGLNVLTGETGAGKSIIVDAVGALLGDKLGPEVVRTGADRAFVDGVFLVARDPPSRLAQLLDEHGLQLEDGALIVSREIAGVGGRGGARVNGRSVPLAVLQELGEQLVDVHGQSQHMALLRTREQLEYLDRFGNLLGERTAVARQVSALRSAREERGHLMAEERQAARTTDVLRFEIAEIEAAQLAEGEEEELRSVRSRLQHVERLRQLAAGAYEALSGFEGDEGDRPGAIELLGGALAACEEGADFDPVLGEETGNLTAAVTQAEESARTLRAYLDSLEADPAALLETEDRLRLIGDLKRKYGDSVGQILAYGEECRSRLSGLEHREEHLAALEERERALLDGAGEAACRLSAERAAAAARLTAAVVDELGDLQLRGTTFSVSLAQSEVADGVPCDGRLLHCEATGVDRLEFLISANRGEDARPLARVASGGELARIALALKTILARVETRATLIFDEVDAGVGGRTAPVVGEKLWSVARQGHQVLLVTHLPQVAAYADQGAHLVVQKDLQEDGRAPRTQTTIRALDVAGQVEELAVMLAGAPPTEAARTSAQELLTRAGTFKRQHRV